MPYYRDEDFWFTEADIAEAEYKEMQSMYGGITLKKNDISYSDNHEIVLLRDINIEDIELNHNLSLEEIRAIRYENQKLKRKVDDLEASNDYHSRMTSATEHENDNLKKEIEKLKSDNVQSLKEIVALKSDNAQSLEEIKALESDNDQSLEKIKALKLEHSQARKEIEVYKKTLNEMNGHYVQRELIHNGKKLAYKENVSIKEIKALLDKGYSKTQIAETFGISRGTVYRRINEIKGLSS